MLDRQQQTPVHDHAAMIAQRASTPASAEESGFFSGLLEVFTPRQQCMNYEADVVWMHIIADAMIALAYFSIPLALIYFVRRRKDLAFHWMFVLFAAFILACGTTHVFGVIAIWRPYYRLDGLVKMLTGLVSIATAILLWPLVAKALLLPSPSMLRSANERLAAEVEVRQRAEAEARRASEHLERRVEERTAELHAASEQKVQLLTSERAARTEAERAGRIKDDFVATLSHELRTPISAILGWTHLLRANPQRDDALHGLEVIDRNTRAQARMIDDLLDMSRIVAGKLRLDVQTVDLTAVIRAAMETVTPAAEARGVRLQIVLDPAAGPVRGDAARLQQVMWNLLSNAIKFTPHGGRVQISLNRVNSHVEIAVEDSGQGISPTFLPHVFDRFRQEDASTTRTHRGLGIGLSIVRHLVELHGGAVSAQSPGVGEGAVFRVMLPLTAVLPQGGVDTIDRHPSQPGVAVARQAGSTLAGLRLLVVDDEADTRELLARVLTEEGATVQKAGSSAEALEFCLEQPPDVLISDIGMPGEDGYALIRRIRKLPPQSPSADGRASPSRVPAIALTAFARSEDRILALNAGFQAHVAKPAEPDELIATIVSLIQRTNPRSG